MSFHVGQKVVCVSVKMRSGTPLTGFQYPTVNSTYTVRGVRPYRDRTLLYLEEIINRAKYTDVGFLEPGFCSTRFRPLIEQKTSTSFAILEEIRKRESVPEPARVKNAMPAGM